MPAGPQVCSPRQRRAEKHGQAMCKSQRMCTESIGHLGGKAWQERDLAKNSEESGR